MRAAGHKTSPVCLSKIDAWSIIHHNTQDQEFKTTSRHIPKFPTTSIMLVKSLLSVAVLGLSLPMGVLSNPVVNSEARALGEDSQGAELQARDKEPGVSSWPQQDIYIQ